MASGMKLHGHPCGYLVAGSVHEAQRLAQDVGLIVEHRLEIAVAQ